MRWLFQRVLDRLAAQLTLLVAARFESQAEMELTETRAEMLRRAGQLERDDAPGAETLAAELRAAAQRLGRDDRAPAEGVLGPLRTLHAEDLREPESLRLPVEEKRPAALPANNKPSRNSKRS
jgi:hypothetical protein